MDTTSEQQFEQVFGRSRGDERLWAQQEAERADKETRELELKKLPVIVSVGSVSRKRLRKHVDVQEQPGTVLLMRSGDVQAGPPSVSFYLPSGQSDLGQLLRKISTYEFVHSVVPILNFPLSDDRPATHSLTPAVIKEVQDWILSQQDEENLTAPVPPEHGERWILQHAE
jgi:hypothetical protein